MQRHGLIGRAPTVVSLFEFARRAGGGINMLPFFGLTPKLCPGLQNTYVGACDNPWWEDHFQGSRDLNRVTLSHILATREREIADYVGYWPGPKYVTDERHFIKNWYKVVTTQYSHVPVTGVRSRTLLFSGNIDGSGSVPMTREFIQQFNPYFGNVIRYRFGEEGTPLNLPDDCYPLLYPQGTDEIDLSSGDLDTEKTINEAYRLRPYIIVEKTSDILVIDVPLVVAVKPELYFAYPDIKGNMRLLDACNENNFVDKIAVYGETYSKPDGYAKIARRFCNACGGSGCNACILPELPICLIPVSSDEGHFQVRPIRNTGTTENPCWIISDLVDCCASAIDNLAPGRTFDLRFTENCFCTKPLEICINYVSSCNNCYGDDCLDRMACPELLDPLANLVLARLPVYCDCECMKEAVARLKDEWPLRGKGFSRGPVSANFEQYALGNLVGEVEAWLALQNTPGKHRTPQIGMVG